MTGRVLFDGRMRVDHHQAWAETRDESVMDWDFHAAFAGQVNGLLGAGMPGALVLMTGTALGDIGLRLVLHESEPPVGVEWEDVVEASFDPQGPELTVAALGSDVSCTVGITPGTHRARWSGRGMDEAWDLVVEPHEPLVDVFELALWPAAPAPDAVLRRDSERGHWAHLPLTAEGRAEQLLLEWGGGPPIPELVEREYGRTAAGMDRALVEALLAADPASQRRLAVWTVRRGCARHGTDALPWVVAGLDALEAGRPLPPEFSDADAVLTRLQADLGGGTDIGYGGLLSIVQFPPHPVDAALAGIFHGCSNRDRQRQRELLDQARAVLG